MRPARLRPHCRFSRLNRIGIETALRKRTRERLFFAEEYPSGTILSNSELTATVHCAGNLQPFRLDEKRAYPANLCPVLCDLADWLRQITGVIVRRTCA